MVITLHLNNDAAGRVSSKTIQTMLASIYIVSDEQSKRGKDYNDYLKVILGIQQQQELNRE